MNKLTIGVAVTLVFAASTAFASTINLTNGGLGQRSNDPTSFGFAVCNNATADLTAAVPTLVAANGVSLTVQSPAPIAAGACDYAYVPYSSFNMESGSSYSVAVSINGGAASNYSVTVPGGSVLGASAVSPDQARQNLMASEIILLQEVISKLQSLLGITN